MHKRTLGAVIVGIVAVIGIMGFSTKVKAQAQNTVPSPTYKKVTAFNTLRADQTVFVKDEDIVGDALLMGQTVVVQNTKVSGNLVVIAEQVDIEGANITGSIALVGNRISYTGATKGNIYAMGNIVDVTVTNMPAISAFIAGNVISFKGDLQGDLVMAGAHITAAGTVAGRASIVTSESGVYNVKQLTAIKGVKVSVGKAGVTGRAHKQASFVDRVVYAFRWSLGALLIGWAVIYIFGEYTVSTVLGFTKRRRKLLSDALVAVLGISVAFSLPVILLVAGALLRVTLHWVGLGLLLMVVGVLLVVPSLTMINAGMLLRDLVGEKQLLGKQIKEWGLYRVTALAAFLLGVISLLPGGGLVYGMLYLMTLGEIIRFVWYKRVGERASEAVTSKEPGAK